MKRTYYLIDTENVGDRWLDLSDKIGRKDRLIVFYTDHHSKVMEKCLLKQLHNPHIVWLECMAGENALDYQLMGVLSYLITKHAGASFCIYSNDKDYYETVEYWKGCGVRIVQKFYEITEKKKTKSKKKKKKQKQAKKQAEKNTAAPDAGSESPQWQWSEEQLLVEIARAVPTAELDGWYKTLTVILGQENGRSWYLRFKEDEELRAELSRHLEQDGRRRAAALIQLMLKIYGLDETKAEEAYQIIMSHSAKNLKAMKADFDKKFGGRPPQKYYKALRPFIRMIKGK